MAFRFLHTADIHLDSPLKSLAMRNEALAAIVANATRQVMVRIVDLCLSEHVDALLIAGDLYDGDQTSMKTARFLGSQLRRLDDANIAVYIIRGNHDAESKITRELTLPDCVHVFGSKAESIEFKPLDREASLLARSVIIHGASFRKPHAPDSMLPLYQQPDRSAINIGMMHTSLDGAPGHDRYAPCSLADLQSHGYDYWALGHIHKRAVYTESTCTVVMPGIPQGRDIGESGEKSVTLVTITDDAKLTIKEHPIALAHFEQIEVSLEAQEDWSSAINVVMSEIDQLWQVCDAEHLVARVVLTGRTPLAWKLRRDEDLFVQDIIGRLEDDEHRWLDKLIIQCDPPADEQEDLVASSSPYIELHDLMIKEIKQSPVFQNHAQLALEDLLRVLPAEVRTSFGDNEQSLEKTIESLALQGSTLITAKLQPESISDESVEPFGDQDAVS